MIYGNDNWAAYMAPNVRAARTARYKSLSMGGTTDWALDLEKFMTHLRGLMDLDGKAGNGLKSMLSVDVWIMMTEVVVAVTQNGTKRSAPT
jgi:hypothetical protein